MKIKKLECITQGRGETKGSTFRILERTDDHMIQEHVRNGEILGYEVGRIRKSKPNKQFNNQNGEYDLIERPWDNEDFGGLAYYYSRKDYPMALKRYRELTLGLPPTKPHTLSV